MHFKIILVLPCGVQKRDKMYLQHTYDLKLSNEDIMICDGIKIKKIDDTAILSQFESLIEIL